MIRYVSTNDDGRIVASTDKEEYAEGMFEQEFDDDFDFSNQYDYVIRDGEVVYESAPPSEAEIIAELRMRERKQMKAALTMFVTTAGLTDEQALTVSELYPEWEVGGVYKTGDIRKYLSNLYRALQDSTGQEQYTPDTSVSLWKKIEEPGEDGIFPWS